MKALLCAALMAALLATTFAAHAGTAWDEAVDGDLSNSGLSPTALSFTPGHNAVIGTTGDAGSGVDRDYFSFTVPAGSVLSALWLLPNTLVSGGASFIGLQAGPQLTVTPTGGGIDAFYGFGHYANDQIGSDILATIVGTAKAPAPAGTYSVWVQETGGPATYGLDFVITAVPEPAPAWTLALGLLALGGRACRRFVLQRR